MKFSVTLLSVSVAFCLSQFASSPVYSRFAPPVSLANSYHQDIDLRKYWVSEKFDGARAWWDGNQFISRGGNVYHAPDWFTDELPNVALDGELWIGRGHFQQLMQTIRDQQPDDDAWRDVRFLVFDAPHAIGDFRHRQQYLSQLLTGYSSPWLRPVEQRRVDSHEQLQQWLDQVTSAGGEGLMLQRDDWPYHAGRHDGLLKLKTHQDAEAVVIGYRGGKGKYTGLMGSLLVQDANGLQFRIGSGFTDIERRDPPLPGATVTYRYQGRTQSGKPRFARFLRVRMAE